MISTFEWTNDAAQRILRVPTGFMWNKTQERIEELARERAAATIDLRLVEEGIEIGKRMMAEIIATYPSQGRSPEAASAALGAGAVRESGPPSQHWPVGSQGDPTLAKATRVPEAPGATPAAGGGGYLNEVRAR